MWTRYLKAPYLGGVALIAAWAAGAGTASEAEAAFAMRVTQGASVVTIADEGAGDLGGGNGFILFSGSVGEFFLNVNVGQSDPVLPPPLPHLDLNVTATTSAINAPTLPATLVVELSQTGFDHNGLQGYNTHWGPVVPGGGTSELDVYIDRDDALFGTSGAGVTQVADLGPVTSPGAFLSATGLAIADPSYSVTLKWTITHTGLGTTTGNANFQIPEPGSLALLGIGLLGLGGALLRRRRDPREPAL